MSWPMLASTSSTARRAPCIRAETGRLGEAEARGNLGSHAGEPLQELPGNLLAAVDGDLQAAEVVVGIAGHAPLVVEHGGDLADDVDPVLLDGLERARGVEDLQHHGRASPEQGGHEGFGLSADVGGWQVDEQAGLSSPKPKAAPRHRFWQVMLRWESRAGLGLPVEPVVKMT